MPRCPSACSAVALLAAGLASCGSPNVCGKYEAEFECQGTTREQCEENLESCTDSDRRIIDDTYACWKDVGLLACDASTTMTSTEVMDAIRECGEEMGSLLENISDECAEASPTI